VDVDVDVVVVVETDKIGNRLYLLRSRSVPVVPAPE
jgi:hypothetical protein